MVYNIDNHKSKYVVHLFTKVESPGNKTPGDLFFCSRVGNKYENTMMYKTYKKGLFLLCKYTKGNQGAETARKSDLNYTYRIKIMNNTFLKLNLLFYSQNIVHFDENSKKFVPIYRSGVKNRILMN